jgi:hypothetical protein
MKTRRIPESLVTVDEFRMMTGGQLPEPEHTLVLRGRLTPVMVGGDRYYLRSDMEALTGGAK